MMDIGKIKDILKKLKVFLFSPRFVMTGIQFFIFFVIFQTIFDSFKMYLPPVLRLFVYLIFVYLVFTLIKRKSKK